MIILKHKGHAPDRIEANSRFRPETFQPDDYKDSGLYLHINKCMLHYCWCAEQILYHKGKLSEYIPRMQKDLDAIERDNKLLQSFRGQDKQYHAEHKVHTVVEYARNQYETHKKAIGDYNYRERIKGIAAIWQGSKQDLQKAITAVTICLTRAGVDYVGKRYFEGTSKEYLDYCISRIRDEELRMPPACVVYLKEGLVCDM